MAYSLEELRNNIQKELDFLKLQGHERAAIEEKFGYSGNYLDQALVRPTEKVYKSLLLYKEWVLCNTIVGKKEIGKFVLPKGYEQYQSNFDRLASLAEKNADTVNNMSQAHLIMTKAISSGRNDSDPSSGSAGRRDSGPDQDLGISGRTKPGSGKKRKGI